MPHLDIADDGVDLANRTAAWLSAQITGSSGRFALNLSGGSTPRRLFHLLAGWPFATEIDWQRLHVFWGDERYVPFDHPDSNYGMTRGALLDHVPIPASQIYPVPTDAATPAAAAAAYSSTLKAFYGADALTPARPLFDVTLLGLGPDGHTASLFPGVAALGEHEAWTADVVGAKPEPRITLTYPALDASRVIVFLVSGAEKKAVLARVLDGDPDLPASHFAKLPNVRWFVDRAAAP